MKNEQANQALTLIGIALLMVASGGATLQFYDVIKKALLKAIGVEDDSHEKESAYLVDSSFDKRNYFYIFTEKHVKHPVLLSKPCTILRFR